MKRLVGVTLGMSLVMPVVFAQPFGGPPPEAKEACAQANEGDACRFTAPHGAIEGQCRNTPHGKACVPADGGPGRLPSPGGGMSPGDQTRRFQDMPSGGEVERFQGVSANRMRPPRVDIAAHDPSATAVSSRIPDTGQGSCFDDHNLIACPEPGQRWFGQDAQYEGALPSYRKSGDGTVTDRVTGLVWQQAHNAERLTWPRAVAACEGLQLGGHDDWRLPTIKELFSITDFRASGQRPYLNEVFAIRLPDTDVLEGDRFRASHRPEMMGQTWSATIYTGDHWDRPSEQAAFFMNFLDGRIKSAPIERFGPPLFYRCVRGDEWGGNQFVSNGDGTVSDRASGLTWQQADDGRTRDWEGALAYCQGLELSGHDDWRLPNVKELQHIVDYRRNDPAIDPQFFRQSDRRGWFWSSTTLGENVFQATYVCFGKCTSIDGVDVHGAGAQRSDPKSGDPSRYGSQGGQEDEIRARNYARCVRSTG